MPTLAEQLEATKNINQQRLSGQSMQPQSGLTDLGTLYANAPKRESALGVIDRVKYGFSDDWGKQQIIQQAGYGSDQIVRLKNGEYGVKTAQGIKPVDPKGFQFSDMAGDVAESLGKVIPTIGAVAGSAGGILGTAGGAGAGEALRQVIGEKIMKVRRNGLQPEDIMEMAGEGLMAGVGQGTANLIGKKLAQLGGMKLAQSGEQSIQQLLNKKFNPKLVDKVDEFLGMKNAYLSKDLLQGKIAILDGTMADDAIKSGVKQLVNIVENGQKEAGAAYRLRLSNVYGDNFKNTITYGTSEIKNTLSNKIKDMSIKDISKRNTSQINELQNILNSIADKDNITFGQIKNATQTLKDLKSATFINGKPTGITKDIGKIQSEFLRLKNTNEAVKAADQAFSKDIGLINGLQKNAGIRLEQGELVEGFRSPEKLVMRLKDEMSERRLTKLDNIQKMLNQSGIKTDFMTEIKSGLATDILYKRSGIPTNGYTGTIPGLINFVAKKAGVTDINKARMLLGSLKLNPNLAEKEVGRHIGMVQSLANIIGEKTGADNAVGSVAKQVTKASKYAKKISSNKQVQSAVINAAARQAPKSLNQLVYGNQQ